MLDEHRPAVLRGFDTAVADIGDQLHLCQPLLSFEGDPTLYVARRLDWQDDRKALAVADPSEASELGTLLPDTHRRTIASGEAVVAVGAGFVRAAKASGVQLDGSEMDFARVHDAECWISVATPARFANLKTRLADEARTAFDEDLGDAALHGRHLSGRGNAALLLLRRCGPRRRDDLAIRQLAGAQQNRELDLYRRLLIRFALELRTQKNDLDEKVERHIALAVSPLRHTTPVLSPPREHGWAPLTNRKIPALNLHRDLYIFIPNAKPSAAMEESNSWNEMRYVWTEAISEKVFNEILATYISRSSNSYIYPIFGQFKKDPSGSSLFTSKLRNRTVATLPKISRERATCGYLPGDVASIRTMKDHKTKNNPAISFAVRTVTAKDVVDTVCNREAAWP